MTTVLCVRANSNYLQFDVDTFGIDRDAWTFQNDSVIIAHPPCAQWSRLRNFSRSDFWQKALALYCVDLIRENGGILEHPAHSKLWSFYGLPRPGEQPDLYGGFSIAVNLHDFGHPVKKPTWLYIVGCDVNDLPRLPLNFNAVTHVLESKGKHHPRLRGLKIASKKMRDSTPVSMIEYFMSVCDIIKKSKKKLGGSLAAL